MWVLGVGRVRVWVYLSTERRTLNYMQGMQHLIKTGFMHAFSGEVNNPDLFRHQQSISCSCSQSSPSCSRSGASQIFLQ